MEDTAVHAMNTVFGWVVIGFLSVAISATIAIVSFLAFLDWVRQLPFGRGGDPNEDRAKNDQTRRP